MKQKRTHSIKDMLFGAIIATIIFTFIMPVIAATISKTATVTYNDIKVVMDGKPINLTDLEGKTVEPVILYDTVYVPLSPVARAFGKTSTYDGKSSTIFITTPQTTASPAPATGETIKLTSLDYFAQGGAWGSWNLWQYADNVRINTGEYLYDCLFASNGYTLTYRDYLLNGAYIKIKGTLFLSYEQRSNTAIGKFFIWGDGKLLYTSPDISSGFIPQDFEVDITGVKVLRIGMDACSPDTTIGISGTLLYK